jgi:hypothetical protein
MSLKKILILLGFAAFFVFINARQILSQQSTLQNQALPELQNTVLQGGIAPTPQDISDVQWIWGEIVNLDTQNKMIVVKHLDYDADQEKEITVVVDDKTTFENVGSIEELKLKDYVSVDYISGSEGKNIAKNIGLEKPEESASAIAPQEGATGMTNQDITGSSLADTSASKE